MTKIIQFAAALTLTIGTSGAFAQEKPAANSVPTAQASEGKAKPAFVPLKLQVVLARYQGEKKISSMPYQMWITANEPAPTRLRMGAQMPVPQGPISGNPNVPVTMSYSLKDVGTNIDCSATTTDNGAYRVLLTVNDNGVVLSDKQVGTASVSMPTYRNFTSTFTILLRDGQTAQYTSATDPVSGEVLKIDATLNVLK